MSPIVIVYHGLFYMDNANNPLDEAFPIIRSQMDALMQSGLLLSCQEMIVGLNGDDESRRHVPEVFPSMASVMMHGLDSKNENSTIKLVEDVAKRYDEAYILYFHAKGATHRAGTRKALHRMLWRDCMMKHLVRNWTQCVDDLDKGVESAGCHWLEPPDTPATQYIWAGNFWWAKASFIRTLPSIESRERVKLSGLKTLESRYESEVWIGNGPRRPVVKDYCPGWNPGKRHV